MLRFALATLAAGLALAATAATPALAAPPLLSVPDTITVEASGPGGATVGYQVHVQPSDARLQCSPGPGAVFPVGMTQVACTATNLDTGESASQTFVVVVLDRTPPSFAAVSDVTAEATSRSGAKVAYTKPMATDLVDGPVAVSCAPDSGAALPFGRTTVTCSATDAHGNSAKSSFGVVVRDTKPPVLTRPAAIVKDVDGVTTARVSYGTPRAIDAVDGAVHVLCSPAPGSPFPLGTTTVRCRTKDSKGNASSVSFTIAVKDTTPPPTVVGLATSEQGDSVTLTWHAPPGSDFGGVLVVRTPGIGKQASSVVYSGSGTTYTDRSTTHGARYRYAVISVDHAGNRSPAVLATSEPSAIIGPPDGTHVTAPPLLRWVAVPKADYYNIQLYLGETKVLSIWPTTNQLQLGALWDYSGKRHTLTPGTYHWFVWPGFGRLTAAKYGRLLGGSSFVVTG